MSKRVEETAEKLLVNVNVMQLWNLQGLFPNTGTEHRLNRGAGRPALWNQRKKGLEYFTVIPYSISAHSLHFTHLGVSLVWLDFPVQ